VLLIKSASKPKRYKSGAKQSAGRGTENSSFFQEPQPKKKRKRDIAQDKRGRLEVRKLRSLNWVKIPSEKYKV